MPAIDRILVVAISGSFVAAHSSPPGRSPATVTSALTVYDLTRGIALQNSFAGAAPDLTALGAMAPLS